jgi:hypothetical protein
LGFLGWLLSLVEILNPENADVRRPMKKPRKRDLDANEKAFNRQISSNTPTWLSNQRVKVEHTIGQCKIFRIVKDEVRAVNGSATIMVRQAHQPPTKMIFVILVSCWLVGSIISKLTS